MKKLFFMTAVVGLALTSCSQEELSVPNAENNEITFALPVVGKNNRAVTEVVTNYVTGYTFGVWAKYYTDAATSKAWSAGKFYIGTAGDNGVEAVYQDATYGWHLATPYYWPKNGNLSFIAYSPSTAAATVTNQGIQFTNYTVGADANVDLLFSEIARNKTKDDVPNTSNSPESYKGIELTFKHALSSVRFAVKTAGTYTSTTIKVKNINVLNAYSEADFNQGLADTDNAVTDLANACWSGYAKERNYAAFAGDITVTDAAKYVHSNDADPTANTTDLILLPQPLQDGTQVKVQVKYTITSPNGSTFDQVTELPLTGTWTRGTRYTYTINFGLDEIYLDPSVEAWDDANGGEITI